MQNIFNEPSAGIWCVLGTLGSLPSAPMPLSFALRFRFSAAGFSAALPDWAGDAVICPAESPFEESFGLEGFEDEYRRLC